MKKSTLSLLIGITFFAAAFGLSRCSTREKAREKEVESKQHVNLAGREIHFHYFS